MTNNHRKTILLVEDEALIAMVEKKHLEYYGYRVIMVHSGEEAVQLVDATPGIDLILMDIDLGSGMDGTEAAERILRQRDLPIVFLSSHTEPEIVEKTEAITSYGYVVKNSGMTVLDASIKMAFRLFEARQREQEQTEKLRESEAKLRRITENITDVVFTTDLNLKTTYISPSVEKLLGEPPELHLARSLEEKFPPHTLLSMQFMLKEELEKEKDPSCDPRRTRIIEVEHYKADGSLISVSMHVAFLRDDQGAPIGLQGVTRDITERKRAEAQLRLQSLVLDQIHDSVTVTDIKGVITYVNDTAARSLSYSRDELIGGTTEKYGDDPERGATQRQIIEETLEHGQWRGEVVNFAADGSEHIMDCRTQVIHDENGTPVALCGIATDITERKQAEEALKSSQAYIRNIIESSLDMIIAVDLERRIVEFNKAAQRTFGYLPEEVLDKHIDMLYADPYEGLLIHQATLQNGQCVREIFNKRKNGQIFPCLLSASSLRDAHGELVGIMGVSRDITERQHAEKLLKESEARYRTLFEEAAISLWEQDMSGVKHYINGLREAGIANIRTYFQDHSGDIAHCASLIHTLSVNKATLTLYNANSQEELLRNFQRIFCEESLDGLVEGFIAIAEGAGYCQHEALNRNLNGEKLNLMVRWIVAPGHEKTYQRVLVSIIDITERKRAEQSLQESEEKYRTLVENITDVIYTLDADGCITFITPTAYNLSGYTYEDLIGKKFTAFVHPDDLPGLIESYQKTLRGEIAPHEYRIFIKDGSVRYIRTSSKLTGSGGIITGIMADITERKRAEELLIKSEARYRTLFEEAAVSLWEQDLSDVKRYLDRLRESGMTDLRAYFQDHPEDVLYCVSLIHNVDVNKAALNLYHANSREDLFSNFQSIFCKESLDGLVRGFSAIAEGAASCQHEALNRNLTGEKLNLIVRWVVIPGDKETYQRVLVSSLDITERKRTEQALQESEQRYRTLFERSHDAIFVVDMATGRYLDANAAAEKLTGRPLAELTTMTTHDVSPAGAEERLAQMACAEETLDFGEVTYARPDGSPRTALLSAVPLGAGIGFGIAHDITERKQAEEALAQSEKKFRTIMEQMSDLVFVTDAQGVIIYLSPAAQNLFGAAPAEMEGRVFTEFLAETAIIKAMSYFTKTLSAGAPSQNLELTMRRKDGSLFTGELNAALYQQENLTGTIGLIRDITDRKRIEQALRESEEHYRTLFEILPIPVFTKNRAGEYTSSNTENLRYWEVNPIGHTDAELLPPEIAAALREADLRVMTTGETLNFEERFTSALLGERHVLTRKTPLRNSRGEIVGILGASLDITERQQTEERISLLAEMLAIAPNSITIHDFNGVFLYANQKTFEMHQCEAHEFMAMNLHEIDVPESEALLASRLQRIADIGEAFFEVSHFRKDKSAFPMEIYGKKVTWAGKPAILSIGTDISERKRAEETLRMLNENLELRVQQRTAELEAANKELKEFAYIVSHDLKAPLRGISQLAHWLREDCASKLDEQGREQLDLLHEQVKRMDTLIDGILRYSRAIHGSEHEEAVDLSALVSRVIAMLMPPTYIVVRLEDPLPVVPGDPVRITQVFQNLLSNAVKFMDKPSGQIIIGCKDAGDVWTLWVEDNGPGIEPRYQERIFQIFQTGAPREKSESTGVGLTIVKKIVELYGGRIWVESSPERGSRFSFTWPKNSRKKECT